MAPSPFLRTQLSGRRQITTGRNTRSTPLVLGSIPSTSTSDGTQTQRMSYVPADVASSANGTLTTKVEPTPGAEVSPIRPPSASTICRAT